jgi:signal transduction histidine kinase/DNA-binding response OmpR family regulator
MELMAVFLVGMDLLGIMKNHVEFQPLITSIGFMSLPVCFSLFIADDFSRTNRSLEKQLIQVDKLSKQALAQQAEKSKLLEEEAGRLDRMVHQRTREVNTQKEQLEKMNEEIQQQTHQLRALDKAKTTFFSNITHEFRTPLTLILGPASEIIRDTKEPAILQNATLIKRNANRLLQLVNQLLDLNKLEAGKMRLVTRPGDIIAFIKRIVDGFKPLAMQKELHLQYNEPTTSLLTVFDHDKLEKILSNVLSNAFKFSKKGNAVVVTVTSPHERTSVTVEISDDGPGIPADKIDQVFDRFFQVDDSDTRSQEGSGIGLALTKELVQLHGGDISLQSDINTGTIVRLIIPTPLVMPVHEELSEQVEADPAIDDLAGDPSVTAPDYVLKVEPLNLPLVLIVEDNEDLRGFISTSMSGQYTVIEAQNGQQGIETALRRVPDLIISDLMMPGVDGFGLCAALKKDERTSHIPIIMLTAKTAVENRIRGYETGADAYVTKPFNMQELLAQVKNLVNSRKELRENYKRIGVFGMENNQLPSMENSFLKNVRSIIHEHIDDEQLSVDLLSSELAMSRMQLHRKLKALVNLSPGELIREIRLEYANELLRNNVATVAEVAYQVGFGNPANFATSFSRRFGYPPSEARKNSSH